MPPNVGEKPGGFAGKNVCGEVRQSPYPPCPRRAGRVVRSARGFEKRPEGGTYEDYT